MPADLGPGVVVFRRTGSAEEIDAIDQYSRRLVDSLARIGVQSLYEPRGLSPISAMRPMPSWVLLQYNPFRFGRAGFAPALLRDAMWLRRARIPLAVMVHEAWVKMVDWRTTLIGSWQRLQLRALLALADAVMTSTEALALQIGRGAVHVPIATNIAPVSANRSYARDWFGLDGELTVALFGRAHPSRALDHAEAALAALAREHGYDRLAVLNLGADAPRPTVTPGVALLSPGRQDEHELSLGLTASDLILLPLVDGVSTRRGTLMAALAHGRPVVGLVGENTDRILAQAREEIMLTPAGDPSAYARAAVALSRDQERMHRIGEAACRLYTSQFDWPVLARRVAGILESIA